MNAVKFLSYASSLLLVDLVVASNTDGYCTVEETYTEPVTFKEIYSFTIPFTKKCGLLLLSTCYEYKIHVGAHNNIEHVKRSRSIKKCCPGYKEKENKCDPICFINCVNGECTSPNKCTCNIGYEPSVFNYRCFLKCEEGYKYNPESRTCIAVCTTPCLNGQCTQPEVCTCSNGYHKNDIGICIENECDPTSLENGICRNGTCMPNGICSCNKGFVKNNSSNECLPVCIGCNNGNCVAPGKCLCNAGFEWNDSRLTCVPKCSQGCLNGNCTSPDNCVCNEGYQSISSSNNICNPVCLSGCLNGLCIKPNVCSCNLGYELDESLMLCVPTCDEECVNSNCTAPNVCTCELGFSRINSTVCGIPCVNCTNGYCEIANKCQCDSGYHMSNDNGTCIPNECSSNILEDSCVNGYCSDDGFCVCNSGYTRNISMICSPDCSLECINGYCSEPEVCQCYDGYEIGNGTDYLSNCTNCLTILSNWNVCDPICENCLNGNCIQPDVCICSDGYEEHSNNKGICLLIKESDNSNLSSSANSSSGYLWIIFVTGLAIGSGATAIFVYRRFFKRVSYRCNSEADTFYHDEDHDSVFL